MLDTERAHAAGLLAGYYPARVDSYDGASRTCRVAIFGLTEGAEALPVAEILYPIGDKSSLTELEILPGDAVWVVFIAGDARHPLITGYRNPTAGNSTGTRRFHHQGMELAADGTLTVRAAQVILEGVVKINGVVQVGD